MEYYGVSSSTESFLAHYGVRGMKWGVRKAINKYKEKRNDRKIFKYSRSAQFPGKGGFMNSPSKVNKNSERQKLANRWNNEWETMSGKGARKLSNKEMRYLDNKYRKDYVHAVLKDSKLPVTKKNVSRAYNVLLKTDETFARNCRRHKK